MKLETLPPISLTNPPQPALPAVALFSQAAAARHRTAMLLIVLGLLAVGWAAYAPVTGFDFIPLDDPGYVYENQNLRQGLSLQGIRWAFTTMERANWHPLTWLSLLADYQVYGMNSGGYHLTNLLLHETASVLLFCWLVLATRRLWTSAGVALLFCIHPAHVESVAWVTERKDVLSTVFFFLVLLAYTRYAQTKKAWYYLAALAALTVGLLAKPMLVTVPPLLLLLDAWPLGRLRGVRDFPKLAAEKIPFALIAGASCVVTFIAQHRGGATVALDSLPLSWRLSSTVIAYAAYVGKLVWPNNLGVFYPYWTSLPAWRTAACAAGLLGATAGAVFLYRTRPYLLIGWLWFVGTLVPVIGLVQVGSQAMADRYTYQPSVGWFIALCWAVADFWQGAPKLRPALAAACVCALAACFTLCRHQVSFWQNGVTLLEHTLSVTRSTPDIRVLLGESLAKQHRYAEAETIFRSEFKAKPNDPDPVTRLGYLHLGQAHWEEACQWLHQVAMRPGCKDPILYSNLGFALNRLGRTKEAIAALRRSLQLRPEYAFAHCNLGDAFLASGDPDAAAMEYETALTYNLDTTTALTQLSWLYSFADRAPTPQRAQRALVLAQRAVDLTGRSSVASLDSLAAAQAANGDWLKAADSARAALRMIEGDSKAPAEAAVVHRARAEAYRSGHWPER